MSSMNCDMIQREERIGGQRLILGDCLEVIPDLPPVDFVFSDPPYGHNNNNNDLIHKWEAALGKGAVTKQDARPILNDGEEATPLFRNMLRAVRSKLSGGCCCCCCSGGGPDPQFARWSLIIDEEIGFKHAVVWDKGPMGMGWHYRRSYEFVLVAELPGGPCRWFDDSGKIENVIRPVKGMRKVIPQANQHPTVKPVALCEHFIRLHSQEGHHVLDPFMGSGTTLVACERLGRQGTGIELDPEYFDIACKRVEEAARQPRDMFIEPAKPQQEAMDL